LDILSSSQLITRAHHGDWYRFGATAVSMANTPAHDANNTWDDSYYQDNNDPWANDGTPICPVGWRLPTNPEFAAAINKDASNGNLGTDNNTLARPGTWSNSTSNFSALLKVGDYLYLPAAGYRGISDGSLGYRGSTGYYWSSSAQSSLGWSATFYSGGSNVTNANRAYGFSVRCVAAE
jgi:uncharacterized protein (TIGR02145 family)